MDFREIRRVVITAVFSDDVLFEQLVLKGGNALDIVHGLGARASLDVDLSIDGDFENVDDAKRRLFRALGDRFGSAGYIVFDLRFEMRPPRPKKDQPEWGGYTIEFKIIEKVMGEKLGDNLDSQRRNAALVGPQDKRTFRIEISRNEYCVGKQEVEVDAYTVYVYSLPMIAIEKLRAICQQMDEYPLRVNKTGRARDFFDIHLILSKGKVDLLSRDNIELIERVFAAKKVPVDLLGNIANYREFHRADWGSVVNAVNGKLREFDYYFDYVLRKTKKLETLRIE